MKREWKPGDVAMVADEYSQERVAVYGSMNPRMKHHWHYDESGIGRIIAGPRPLVVIDPEDREQVDRLHDLIFRTGTSVDRAYLGYNETQAALREFANPKPPRPEEPTGVGAVVEDAEGRCWTRVGRNDAGRAWGEVGDLRWRDYADIDAVRVLSEGVDV